MTDRLSDAQLAELVALDAEQARMDAWPEPLHPFDHVTRAQHRRLLGAALRKAFPHLIAEIQAHRSAKAAEHASAEALAGMMPLGGGEP